MNSVFPAAEVWRDLLDGVYPVYAWWDLDFLTATGETLGTLTLVVRRDEDPYGASVSTAVAARCPRPPRPAPAAMVRQCREEAVRCLCHNRDVLR